MFRSVTKPPQQHSKSAVRKAYCATIHTSRNSAVRYIARTKLLAQIDRAISLALHCFNRYSCAQQ